VPVPNALAGVMGIVGMFIASVAFDYIVKLFESK
jgi:XapX domain-containing protein